MKTTHKSPIGCNCGRGQFPLFPGKSHYKDALCFVLEKISELISCRNILSHSLTNSYSYTPENMEFPLFRISFFPHLKIVRFWGITHQVVTFPQTLSPFKRARTLCKITHIHVITLSQNWDTPLSVKRYRHKNPYFTFRGPIL